MRPSPRPCTHIFYVAFQPDGTIVTEPLTDASEVLAVRLAYVVDLLIGSPALIEEAAGIPGAARDVFERCDPMILDGGD